MIHTFHSLVTEASSLLRYETAAKIGAARNKSREDMPVAEKAQI